MSLSGTLSTMALGDLLQWVEQGRKSGTLVVQGERYVKRIFTRDGRIIASASNDPNDHLGHFLLRLGLISEPDLKRALEVQQQTRAMLGRILVTIGAVTEERLETLRAADWVVMDEIRKAGLYRQVWQSFAVLTPLRTVGVMGDYRTYANVVALRIVTSDDGMTADWFPFPYDVLGRVSTRIINQVRGVNRVTYDVSSKPPATIEWE